MSEPLRVRSGGAPARRIPATAAPPRRVPREAPRAPAPGRPRTDLRVVEAPGRRRASSSTWAVVGVIGVFIVLFGLAAFHTVLVQGQQRLDDIDREVDAEQARYERQRLAAAQLESPARIVDAAVNELGMVEPETTTYLTPSGAIEAEVETRVGTTSQGPAEPPAASEQATAPVGSWMTIKPYLDDGR